jgi:hypothetical protein
MTGLVAVSRPTGLARRHTVGDRARNAKLDHGANADMLRTAFKVPTHNAPARSTSSFAP